MVDLGSIESVDPRAIWAHEANDFTPWLAHNLDRLGDALGIELELVEREASVGDFSLDLLATDLNRNATAIIENQLATTDHDHLGKLITYASGHDASVIIWLSTAIREEHRQAIDWLNQRTDEKTDFYAVVIDVVKIGESKPAVQFKVAASPNAWQKSTKTKTKVAPSGKSELYLNYFQSLIDELRDAHNFTGAKKAQPQNWYSFSSGNKTFRYGHSFAARNRIRTEIYIDNGNEDENKAFFDAMFQQRAEIETEYGGVLEWERLDDKRACRIAIYRDGSIDVATEELQQINDWAIKHLLKLQAVFGPKA